MSKKNTLDQYYTRPEIADWCWQQVLQKYPSTQEEYIEPSAGTGAFLRHDINIQCFDLEPKHPLINKQDFLQVEDKSLDGKIIIGNPPFGWASSLALKFINKSKYAKAVCFILPKTFMKELFQEKVDKCLHLVSEWELPKNSFILNGDFYDVPCCFQIWERKEYPREILNIKSFVEECADGDLFIRRVGGRSGMFVSEDEFTPSTTYRVKCSRQTQENIIELYPKIKKVASQTAGVRSITLREINYLLTKKESSIA